MEARRPVPAVVWCTHIIQGALLNTRFRTIHFTTKHSAAPFQKALESFQLARSHKHTTTRSVNRILSIFLHSSFFSSIKISVFTSLPHSCAVAELSARQPTVNLNIKLHGNLAGVVQNLIFLYFLFLVYLMETLTCTIHFFSKLLRRFRGIFCLFSNLAISSRMTHKITSNLPFFSA